MTKQETEQQLAEAIAVAQRLGEENKQLKQANKEQSTTIAQLKIDLNDAINKVRELSEQLNIIYARQQATDRFNDNDRKY